VIFAGLNEWQATQAQKPFDLRPCLVRPDAFVPPPGAKPAIIGRMRGSYRPPYLREI